jgi:hypothetical protein
LKIENHDLFINRAASIIVSLQESIDIMRDISNFTNSAISLLLSIPREIIHFKLEKNSLISITYFDLLLCYMRILMLFSSIHERNNIYVLYRTACQFQSVLTPEDGVEKKIKLNLNEISTLLSSTNNIQLYFISIFKPITLSLSPMVLQFQDSILLSENIDLLKSKNVFNIKSDEDNKSNICNDLLNISKYKEYVIFGFLACPELLLQWELFDLFQLVTSKLFVISIFRDMVSTEMRTYVRVFIFKFLFICICIYIYTCIYIYIYVYIYMYVYILSLYLYAYTYIYMHYIYTYIYIYIYINIFMRAYVCLHIHACRWIFLCMYAT